jgi:hypothetical protein
MISALEHVIVLIVLGYGLLAVLKVGIAIKAPDAYKTIEEIEDKRRDRQKETIANAAKLGVGACRMFRNGN